MLGKYDTYKLKIFLCGIYIDRDMIRKKIDLDFGGPEWQGWHCFDWHGIPDFDLKSEYLTHFVFFVGLFHLRGIAKGRNQITAASAWNCKIDLILFDYSSPYLTSMSHLLACQLDPFWKSHFVHLTYLNEPGKEVNCDGKLVACLALLPL